MKLLDFAVIARCGAVIDLCRLSTDSTSFASRPGMRAHGGPIESRRQCEASPFPFS
jgi:hypothetical protein